MLRQSQQELRGEELASEDKIVELLATVRRESTGTPHVSTNVDTGRVGGQVDTNYSSDAIR